MLKFISLDLYDVEDGSSKSIHINASHIQAFGDSGTLPADVYEDIPRIAGASFVYIKPDIFWLVTNSAKDICKKLN